MKKFNVIFALVFTISFFIVSSCNKTDTDPIDPVDKLINKFQLTRLSEEATKELLKNGNYRSFNSA